MLKLPSALALPAIAAITLGGCGGGGSSSSPPPTVALTATASTIATGAATTLSWTSTNANSCAASGSWSGALGVSGSQDVTVTRASAAYTVTCSGAGGSASSTAIIATAPLTFDLKVQYQAPGVPVVNAAGTYYVPGWANPTVAPVPFLYVELDDQAGGVVQTAYADVNGVAHFSGLDPMKSYTPQIRSQVVDSALNVDLEVLNNTDPIDTSQGSFRARYAPYTVSFAVYKPTNQVHQSQTVTTPDGWDSASGTLVDSRRVAGPFELLAFAYAEAKMISAAANSTGWRPLSILWSVTNKGGLASPPDNYDLGTVTGSGAFYTSNHGSIDTSGVASGASISEDFIFLSGDQTFEAMDLYPTLMSHEMGHFAQSLFSAFDSPGGDHSYDDYEDPTLAWIEGSASGIAALVMNTPLQNRLGSVSGEIVVGIYDVLHGTISGNPQSWPVGWYQESTTTALMWSVYDPGGTMKLSAAATLAPMFSSAWLQGPWLNSIWAYGYLLKQSNAAITAEVDNWGVLHNTVFAGNDIWGSSENNSGTRTLQDSLPPFTPVTIGQTLQVCSAGDPLEYNKEGNVRFLFLQGDGASHNLTVQGPAGTVPVIQQSLFNAGSATVTTSGTAPTEGAVVSVGDCAVAYGQYSSDTASCSEPAAPPAEQCWTVTWQ